jgi:hypothetical protein
MDNDEYPRAVSQYKMLCWTSSFGDGQAFAVNAPVVQPAANLSVKARSCCLL